MIENERKKNRCVIQENGLGSILHKENAYIRTPVTHVEGDLSKENLLIIIKIIFLYQRFA